ncbi:hypothetical protein ASG52_12355 [Methylobacterium sp. Leaf456]|uniref:DUF6894 family protein n=1 Tax=Methylobacterium sp. Leaf456 TaxID=1736382 RepID=UPI0006F5002F|nr:hypothetical protein [Methylobacterium sp. Leaf456]KQT46516.1 hypothetical protein ASG52_12355 [Methylobacterium sp. Leaf456]
MLLYIDVVDGDTLTRDEDGIDFANLDEASAAAVALLPALARDAVQGPRRRIAMLRERERCIAAEIRDAAGAVLFRTRLRLDMEWPGRGR